MRTRKSPGAMAAVAVLVAVALVPAVLAQAPAPAPAKPAMPPALLEALRTGRAPMDLTGPNGVSLADRFKVLPNDGTEESKFQVAEDATDVAISEHSVAYNTDMLAAAAAAGATVGKPDPVWTLTNNETGQTQNAGAGGTDYTGVIKTPGLYNLSNSGITQVTPPSCPPPSGTPETTSVVVASGAYGNDQTPGTISSGTSVELEVTDITAPALRVVVVPEDYHQRNQVDIIEAPDQKDAYPITAKKAQLKVTGKNWSPAVSDWRSAPDVQLAFTAPAGTVAPEDLPKVGNSALNSDVKTRNDYLLNQSLSAGLKDGFYVPVSVRCNFEVAIPDDNDPRPAYRQKMKTTWKLVVSEGALNEEFQEPPSYIFRKANFPPAPGAPTYTLVAEGVDGSGNSVVCRVPINVLPVDLKVTDLDHDTQKR